LSSTSVLFGPSADAVGRDRANQLFGSRDALFFDLFEGDRLHRERTFLGDTLDATAGDLDPLDRSLGLHLLCHGRAHHSNQGNHVCQLL
jgi:hypothetical protein